jgi:hypothetical protein
MRWKHPILSLFLLTLVFAAPHGFTKIMSAPWGIQTALEAATGYKRVLQ